MDLKEIFRDAARKCDHFKVAATQAHPADRETLSQIHLHFEQICRLIVHYTNRKS